MSVRGFGLRTGNQLGFPVVARCPQMRRLFHIMLAIIRLPNRYVFIRLKDSPLGVSCTVTGLIDGHEQLKVIRVVALPIRYDL